MFGELLEILQEKLKECVPKSWSQPLRSKLNWPIAKTHRGFAPWKNALQRGVVVVMVVVGFTPVVVVLRCPWCSCGSSCCCRPCCCCCCCCSSSNTARCPKAYSPALAVVAVLVVVLVVEQERRKRRRRSILIFNLENLRWTRKGSLLPWPHLHFSQFDDPSAAILKSSMLPIGLNTWPRWVGSNNSNLWPDVWHLAWRGSSPRSETLKAISPNASYSRSPGVSLESPVLKSGVYQSFVSFLWQFLLFPTRHNSTSTLSTAEFQSAT